MKQLFLFHVFVCSINHVKPSFLGACRTHKRELTNQENERHIHSLHDCHPCRSLSRSVRNLPRALFLGTKPCGPRPLCSTLENLNSSYLTLMPTFTAPRPFGANNVKLVH